MFDPASGTPGFSVWEFGGRMGGLRAAETVRVETRAATARFEREITLDNFRLADYEVARSWGGTP